jgi:hypothetical protein
MSIVRSDPINISILKSNFAKLCKILQVKQNNINLSVQISEYPLQEGVPARCVVTRLVLLFFFLKYVWIYNVFMKCTFLSSRYIWHIHT